MNGTSIDSNQRPELGCTPTDSRFRSYPELNNGPAKDSTDTHMEIACVDPQTNEHWRELVENHDSSVFHSPEWARVLTETYGFDVSSAILLNDVRRPVAGLPFCRIEDISGERIVSLPFSDYCDPLVSNEEQWVRLIDGLIAEDRLIAVRCLHNQIPCLDDRFREMKRAKWHCMDLTDDAETLWAGLHESSRRAIRKARRDGVSVRAAEREEDMRAFFELHLGVRVSKYRLLAQPYRFFERVWTHFIEPGKGFLLLAEHQGHAIGGVLFLEWKGTLYYKFNASILSGLRHRPNDLLIWEGIQRAKANGCRALDFGLSDWDQEGLVRYKRKFATEEKVITFLRYLPQGTLDPREEQARNLLGKMTDLFTGETVPSIVTEQAGDVLYRFFT